MDLLNLLDHKKNTRVLVNGTIYVIGPDGVAKDIKDDDAAKLLQNDRVWKKYDPKKAAALRAAAKKAAKGRMQLIGANGPIAKEDKPGDPMDPNLAVYKRPDPTGPKPKETPQVPETAEAKEEAAPEPEDEDGEKLQIEDAGEDDSEWPDPDEGMDIGYLREMAEAYEVPFNVRTPKKTLVKRIHAAMYE